MARKEAAPAGFKRDAAGNVRRLRPGDFGWRRTPSAFETRTTAKRATQAADYAARSLAARERMTASGIDPHTAYLYSIGRTPKTIPPEVQAGRERNLRRQKENRQTEIIFQQELSKAVGRARKGFGPESLNARLTGEAASAVYEAVGWRKEGTTGPIRWIKPDVQQNLPKGWRIDPGILKGLLDNTYEPPAAPSEQSQAGITGQVKPEADVAAPASAKGVSPPKTPTKIGRMTHEQWAEHLAKIRKPEVAAAVPQSTIRDAPADAIRPKLALDFPGVTVQPRPVQAPTADLSLLEGSPLPTREMYGGIPVVKPSAPPVSVPKATQPTRTPAPATPQDTRVAELVRGARLQKRSKYMWY